jgi:hypothetical protein
LQQWAVAVVVVQDLTYQLFGAINFAKKNVSLAACFLEIFKFKKN